MEEKKQKYLYIFLYVFTYIAFSFAMTQFTPFLSKLGYNSMERGILLSSFAVMTIILQMVFGFLSDKYKTVKKFMALILLIYGSVAYLFYTKRRYQGFYKRRQQRHYHLDNNRKWNGHFHQGFWNTRAMPRKYTGHWRLRTGSRQL